MSDNYDQKLVHLPGTKLTPEVVLHRTMNKLSHIAAVVVVIQWDDGTFDVDWSQMKISELCMSSMVLAATAQDTAVGRRPENVANG